MRIVECRDYIEAVFCLNNGGVVFLPADTIYGLSSRADIEEAVKKISHLKGRTQSKPFILITDEILKLEEYIEKFFYKKLKNLFLEFELKGITFIVKAERFMSFITSDDLKIAFRIVKGGVIEKVLYKLPSPLVSTSANPEGLKPAGSLEEAVEYFRDSVDLYLDCGRIEGEPSTIIDLTGDVPSIVREGRIFPDKNFYKAFGLK